MLLAGSAQIEAVLAVGHPERAEDLEPHPMIASCFRAYARRRRRWAVVWTDPGSRGVMIEGGLERRLEMFRRIPIAVVVVALVTLMAAPGAYAGMGHMDRPFRATLVGEAHFGTSRRMSARLWTGHNVHRSPGRATHMGKVTASSSHCPVLPEYIGDGLLTIVAANGDKLYGAYDYDPSDETNVIPITITGGTGRFKGASGSLTEAYSIEPQFTTVCTTEPFCFDVDPGDGELFLDLTAPWPWSATLTGTINY